MEPRPYRFELYRDPNGGYRWRLRSRNGSVVCESARAYFCRRAAFRSMDMLAEAFDDDAALVDLTRTP